MSGRRFHTLVLATVDCYGKLTVQAKCEDGTVVCFCVGHLSLLRCKLWLLNFLWSSQQHAMRYVILMIT